MRRSRLLVMCQAMIALWHMHKTFAQCNLHISNDCYLNDMNCRSRKFPFNHMQRGGGGGGGGTGERIVCILIHLNSNKEELSYFSNSHPNWWLCVFWNGLPLHRSSIQRAACGSNILAAVGGRGEVLLRLLLLAALRFSHGLHKHTFPLYWDFFFIRTNISSHTGPFHIFTSIHPAT